MYDKQVTPSNRKSVETVIHSDNAFATVAYLRVKDAELQPKEPETRQSAAVPPLLEDDFASIANTLNGEITPSSSTVSNIQPENKERATIPGSYRSGSRVFVSNVQRHILDPDVEISLEDEMRECLAILQGREHSKVLGRFLISTFYRSSE
jgi:diphthine-ammonia ligase